jgi:hypothetical protein
MSTIDEACADGIEFIMSIPGLTPEEREAEIRQMRSNLGYDDDFCDNLEETD